MHPKASHFTEKLLTIYSDSCENIIKVLEKPLPQTFRVNSLVAEVDTVLQQLSTDGYIIVPGPFENSFIVKEGPQSLSYHSFFDKGYIYIQSLSSMIPAIILDPKAGETILDACAAPGSKTTQIAALSHNEAQIMAVDKDRRRMKTLEEQLERYAVQNTSVQLGDTHRLVGTTIEPGMFDAALVDVPCSSEAYVRLGDSSSFKHWNKHKYKDFVWQQKGLIMAGYRALKPGGRMVYATCTYSVEENEAVVDWLLSKVDDIELLPITLPIDNVKEGLIRWRGKDFDPSLAKTLRIVPNGHFSAFYVALLKKKI